LRDRDRRLAFFGRQASVLSQLLGDNTSVARGAAERQERWMSAFEQAWRANGRLAVEEEFGLYRQRACRVFVAVARARGHHAFHDLEDRAQELYADFWLGWLKRSGEREVPSVAYIVAAMMNKLLGINGRGRSVRPPQLVDVEVMAALAGGAVDPAEAVVLGEQLALAGEIMASLPRRERVAVACVAGRDSKRKGAPPAGYRLAARQLEVSETRAKKLALAGNRRIRAAREQFEAGTWCARWERSLELVAAGRPAEPGFERHARHCARCRLSVARLRRRGGEGEESA
jgi:hypothetical protein